jgi:hypothetical protein
MGGPTLYLGQCHRVCVGVLVFIYNQPNMVVQIERQHKKAICSVRSSFSLQPRRIKYLFNAAFYGCAWYQPTCIPFHEDGLRRLLELFDL